MSNHSKSSTALKKRPFEEAQELEGVETEVAEILPWPELGPPAKELKRRKTRRMHLEGKYLYYKGKKIPILQFQKAGYDKLLRLLIKEIE
jgi:hypothetical protein